MSLSIQPIPCIPEATVRKRQFVLPKPLSLTVTCVSNCAMLWAPSTKMVSSLLFFQSVVNPLRLPGSWHSLAVGISQRTAICRRTFGPSSSKRSAQSYRLEAFVEFGVIRSRFRFPVSIPGFDSTVLCEFRTRLVTGGAESQLLERFLKVCCDHKLIRPRGLQRTDSTHILAAVRTLNRLECVTETMRHTLNVLATVAPDWLRLQSQPEWLERYGSRVEEYRLPKGHEKRQVYALTIGQDGVKLLEAINHDSRSETPQWLRMIPAAQILRQVWLQQYHCKEQALCWRNEKDGLPASPYFIASPYDVQVHYSKKRTTAWLGYKVHLSETCGEENPHLITI